MQSRLLEGGPALQEEEQCRSGRAAGGRSSRPPAPRSGRRCPRVPWSSTMTMGWGIWPPARRGADRRWQTSPRAFLAARIWCRTAPVGTQHGRFLRAGQEPEGLRLKVPAPGERTANFSRFASYRCVNHPPGRPVVEWDRPGHSRPGSRLRPCVRTDPCPAPQDGSRGAGQAMGPNSSPRPMMKVSVELFQAKFWSETVMGSSEVLVMQRGDAARRPAGSGGSSG